MDRLTSKYQSRCYKCNSLRSLAKDMGDYVTIFCADCGSWINGMGKAEYILNIHKKSENQKIGK